MKRIAFFSATLVALAGCATVSQMTATGGSRADGVVRLSYELGPFDKARIDEADALRTAQARCKTWGYNDAEAFGGVTRQCQAPGGLYGCQRWLITKEYQCLGANTPS
jgi:hypothetical protein